MEKFNNFYFESFEFDLDTFQAVFKYSFDEKIYFEEKISFQNNSFIKRKKIDINIINNFLFSLHIAVWVSYYKFYPTANLIIKSWNIDNFQKSFWKKFYLNWLWEFFYKNNINPNWLINFENNSEKVYKKIDFISSNKALVPVWWWKDSIVSIEILKQNNFEFDLFTFCVNDNILYENTSLISWKNRLIIKRELSKNIPEIIKSGYYNWHIPITWIISFVLALCWYIYDYKYLVFSNEKSANFWNTNKFWIEINHQWSKSIEFENDFNDYLKNYLSNDIKLFSLLRPFYEIKIAEIFSKLAKKYFKYFSSCNTNFKIFKTPPLQWEEEKSPFSLNGKGLGTGVNYWCNSCPKCAFVYVILKAFLDEKDILEIFSIELYDKRDLESTFRELAGISSIKPFECVWTNEEVVFWMYLAYKKYKDNLNNVEISKCLVSTEIQKLPYFLNIFENEILPNLSDEYLKNLEKKLFYTDINNSNIPLELKLNIN